MKYFGLKSKGVDYVYSDKNKNMIPDDVRTKVEAIRQEIIDGKINTRNECHDI